MAAKPGSFQIWLTNKYYQFQSGWSPQQNFFKENSWSIVLLNTKTFYLGTSYLALMSPTKTIIHSKALLPKMLKWNKDS